MTPLVLLFAAGVAGAPAPPLDALPPGAVARLGTLRFRHLGGNGLSLAFSPDGKALASASPDGRIVLWEVASGRALRQFQGAPGDADFGGLYPLAFSPDGKAFAAGGKRIDLWDLATGAHLRTLPGKGMAYSLAFSPDSQTLAAANGQPDLHLWPMVQGKEVRRLRCQPPATVVWYSPGGELLGMEEDVVRELTTGKALRRVKDWDVLEQGNPFSPDGKVVASASRRHRSELFNTIHLRDLATGKVRCRLEGHRGSLTSVVFSPDGKTVATAGRDGTIQLWDRATGKERLPSGVGPVVALALSPNGRTLISADRSLLYLWETATGKPHRTLRGHEGAIRSLTLSPDGRTLASGDERAVHLWDLATGTPLRRLEQSRVHTVAFRPDGRTLVAGSASGSGIRLWEIASGEEVRRFRPPPDESWRSQVFAVALTPDGKTLAAGGYGLHLWDVGSGRLLREFVREKKTIKWLRFGPEGRTLASAPEVGPHGEEVVRLWELGSGRERRWIRGPYARFGALALSPDGKTLAGATSSDRPAVRLWEVATGRERDRLPGHREKVTALAFFPDGRRLASGSADTTVLLWDLAKHVLRDRAGAGELSPEELDKRWADLGSPDASLAYRALWILARTPTQAVPYLRARLSPVPPPAPGRISRLVADLDDDRFTVREKASAELARLGSLAEPGLRRVQAGKPSLEVRLRVERLLERLHPPRLTGELLRAVRAVEVLEHAGTPQAREVLSRWAGGAPAARLTREARSALDRLAKR